MRQQPPRSGAALDRPRPLVVGGLAMLLGGSPLEYLASPIAALWLVVTSVGFLVGDEAHRSADA